MNLVARLSLVIVYIIVDLLIEGFWGDLAGQVVSLKNLRPFFWGLSGLILILLLRKFIEDKKKRRILQKLTRFGGVQQLKDEIRLALGEVA